MKVLSCCFGNKDDKVAPAESEVTTPPAAQAPVVVLKADNMATKKVRSDRDLDRVVDSVSDTMQEHDLTPRYAPCCCLQVYIIYYSESNFQLHTSHCSSNVWAVCGANTCFPACWQFSFNSSAQQQHVLLLPSMEQYLRNMCT